MTEKRFVPARRHRDIPMSARLLVSTGLALWLMLGAVGAQHQSAGLFSGRSGQPHKGAPQVQDQINEAFKALEELLAVTQSAAAPNSHWRVQLASWRNAGQAWGETSVTLPAPVQDLNRCALLLVRARRLIEQADGLFLQARDSSDPTRAVGLLVRHEKFQQQARDLLKLAEQSYRATRNAYLKSSGASTLTSNLMSKSAPSASVPKEGGKERLRSVQEACRVLREAANLNLQALRAPELTGSKAWSDTGDKLDALFAYEPESQFHRELMRNCHCPVMTARRRSERLRQLQILRMNPRARDARSRQNIDLAIRQEQQHIQTEIRRTEECYRKVCELLPSVSPPIEPCEDASAAAAYANGFLQGFASCLGGVFYGTIMAIGRDFSDFDLMAEALSRGDANTAGRILAIKGERNRQEFDAFIKSLNPNIYGVSPQEAGFRDGSRLCQFGVIPGVVKGVGGKSLPPRPRPLPRSGIILERLQLDEASALKPINAKGGVGYSFEGMRGGNLPANFKTIDRVPAQEYARAVQNGGALTNPSEIVSIKTVSATPTSLTYAKPGAILSTLKGYLSQLQNFSSHCRRGVTVTAGPNTRRALEVGIPNSATALQIAEIDQAAALARQMGIEMRVFQLSGVEGW